MLLPEKQIGHGVDGGGLEVLALNCNFIIVHQSSIYALHCNVICATMQEKGAAYLEKTATLDLRPTLKEQAENILQRLGIPMSTAVNMFLNQITLVGGIPFPVTLPKAPASVNADLMTNR